MAQLHRDVIEESRDGASDVDGRGDRECVRRDGQAVRGGGGRGDASRGQHQRRNLPALQPLERRCAEQLKLGDVLELVCVTIQTTRRT